MLIYVDEGTDDKINMDIEHECDDDIEPDEKPEWSLD